MVNKWLTAATGGQQGSAEPGCWLAGSLDLFFIMFK